MAGICSVVLAIVTWAGGPITPLALLAIYLTVVWINKFAFAILDAAANGEATTPVPSTEMLGPFTDMRSWVHPVLAAGIAALLYFVPQVSHAPVLIAALLLFPASLGAIVVSDRIQDAVNPLALWHMLRGLAHYYLLLLLGMAVIVALAWLSTLAPLLRVLHIAAIELAFLGVYALTGGMLHARRNELAFMPRRSPERLAQKEDAARLAARQRAVDEIYTGVRVRKYPQAIAALNQWLDGTGEKQLVIDLHAIIDSGAGWSDPRGYGMVLRALITRFLGRRQHALALTVAEAALKASPAFAPEPEAETLELVRYAAQTGRKRLAIRLANNAAGAMPSAALQALQQELSGPDAKP
jgi:hypothetical protein